MAEIYLKRKIDKYLANWKNDAQRKPLIVKGARQVGKTESIRRFAEEYYKSVVYINFVEEPKYKLITEDGYKTDDIIRNISRMDPSKRFEAGETILIFDELQEFPDIATSLKFFKIAHKADQQSTPAIYNIGLTYVALRLYSKAISYFSIIFNQSPNDIDALFELANCYYHLGEISKSKKCLLDILQIEPDNRRALNILDKIQ